MRKIERVNWPYDAWSVSCHCRQHRSQDLPSQLHCLSFHLQGLAPTPSSYVPSSYHTFLVYNLILWSVCHGLCCPLSLKVSSWFLMSKLPMGDHFCGVFILVSGWADSVGDKLTAVTVSWWRDTPGDVGVSGTDSELAGISSLVPFESEVVDCGSGGAIWDNSSHDGTGVIALGVGWESAATVLSETDEANGLIWGSKRCRDADDTEDSCVGNIGQDRVPSEMDATGGLVWGPRETAKVEGVEMMAPSGTEGDVCGFIWGGGGCARWDGACGVVGETGWAGAGCWTDEGVETSDMGHWRSRNWSNWSKTGSGVTRWSNKIHEVVDDYWDWSMLDAFLRNFLKKLTAISQAAHRRYGPHKVRLYLYQSRKRSRKWLPVTQNEGPVRCW